MHLYEINREERHFGFLFMSAILFIDAFRDDMFSLLNERLSTTLHPDEFNVYAEVALFRDHWRSLGDQRKYDSGTHANRSRFLSSLMDAMAIDTALIQQEELFWTAGVGNSKLRYPGNWAGEKIAQIEETHGLHQKLWRLRWLCNAKPDVMIQSNGDIVFIEIKVESGMGRSASGYDQPQTQRDIIRVGRRCIDWMVSARCITKINLAHDGSSEDAIPWETVFKMLSRYRGSGRGHDMLVCHMEHMP